MVEEAGRPAAERARLVYALHVGGLLHLGDAEFLRALGGGDLVYADGMAVVLLAKAAGARRIERAATTDIGVPALARLRQQLGRPVRLALLGGPGDLAERAGAALEKICDVQTVFTSSGFFQESDALLRTLREAEPDMLLVGMGMPLEAKWTFAHRAELPPAVVLTCGGWFGFLAGEERRAPELMQRFGLEWIYRLRQDFRRLSSRYFRGALTFLSLMPEQLKHRRLSH